MREGALPSRTNQARVISEVLALAKREGFRVSLIEAYDQPWKRQFEGTVGNGWGLIDSGDRAAKYPIGAAVSDYPHRKMQMGLGMGLSALVFAAGFSAFRRKPGAAGLAVWLAVALSATAGGVLVGIAAEKMAYESYRIGDWLRWGALLGAAVVAQLVGANALMAGRRLPTFVELIGPRSERSGSVAAVVLGAALLVTTLIGTETALGLVFDPRYRDFPFAALTMAAVPFAVLALMNRPRSGPRPMAEAVFAGLFVMAALYIGFHEGLENWQAIWTCAGYGLLGIALWQARAAGNKPV
jgi:glucan 1,3-beta-glucosidase